MSQILPRGLRQLRARRSDRPPFFCLLGYTLIAMVGASDLRAEAPGVQRVPAPGCIQTPSEYMTAFRNCLPITCVSPNLYATAMVGPPDAQPAIYPSGFHWAWTVGSESCRHSPTGAGPAARTRRGARHSPTTSCSMSGSAKAISTAASGAKN